ERVRDHPDHLAARLQHRRRQLAHQPDPTAAVDRHLPAADQFAPQLPGRRGVDRVRAGLRPAEHADRLHSPALELFQVVEVGLAVRAADGFEVEFDVVFEPGVDRAEQVAAELLARRATDPVPTPDRPDRVLAAVHLLEHLLQLTPHGRELPQGPLDQSRLLLGQSVVQVVAEHLPGDVGHSHARESAECGTEDAGSSFRTPNSALRALCHGTGSIFHVSGVVRAIARRPSMVIWASGGKSGGTPRTPMAPRSSTGRGFLNFTVGCWSPDTRITTPFAPILSCNSWRNFGTWLLTRNAINSSFAASSGSMSFCFFASSRIVAAICFSSAESRP